MGLLCPDSSHGHGDPVDVSTCFLESFQTVPSASANSHALHVILTAKGRYPSGLRARVLTLTLTLTLTLAMFSNPKGTLKMYMRVRAYATAAHSGSYPNH